MSFEQNFVEFIAHPVSLALLTALILLATLKHWINQNTLDKRHFERCAESYQKIFEAYSAITQNNYVSHTDWENIKEAHWIAKTFLPKEIAQFTHDWAQKSTIAYFLHRKVGRFGHINMISAKIDLEKPIKDESKDEEVIIFELKAKDPTPIYRKYLPTIKDFI